MAIDIKSYNQILGEMVRKIIADTPLNDVNVGSVLLSVLEAAAQVDFENNASILNVLELLNIDATRNSDLDARGADYGLVRTPATRSTGFVTIQDTSITKRSTGLYQVKAAPIAGSTVIYVNDASAWSPTGNLFIGRGTNSFEGPVPYTSIVNNGSFFTINLGSALQKDHLISDVVVDSQGTVDRLVPAGTVVYIPANNQNPIIEFRTLRDAVIPSGEDTATGISIVSLLAGARNNAGINTITNFTSLPFAGATVYNTSSLSDGRDVETDDAFRERIKSYANTLARGTSAAIISAIVGVSDSEDGKQVATATITEPPKIGDPSILYIDDGSGFQPSYAGQSVDVLLSEAAGNEEFLQLANYPLPRPQVVNTADGPYELVDGMQLRVIVDGAEEAVTFETSQFLNISAATISEVIVAINNQSETFKAIFTETSSRILLFPVDHAAEVIQVSPLRSTDDETLFANNILKFPTNAYSYIRLYHNNTLLNEKEKAASLLTTPFSSWNIIVGGNLIMSVDGTPPQDRSFSTTDFGGSPFASLTLEDWVTAFNNKYAGITATATSSGRMQIISNKEGSSSALIIEGGTYFDKFFSNQEISAVGQNSDFELNRQTGNLRILRDIAMGDTVTAGTDDAKGSFTSSETITGNFNVSLDSNNRAAELLVVADAQKVEPRFGVGLAIGNTITVTDQGSDVMRLMSDSLSAFDAAQPHDYIYIASRGIGSWIDPANCGLYRIISKGEHTTASTDSYIEVKNVNIVPGVHVVLASEDIQIFSSDEYPQLWKGSFTATPPSATIQNIVDTINSNLVNVRASIFKTDAIKISSTTEDEGSIALPVSSGNSTLLFESQQGQNEGNPSHIANRVSSKDAVTFFKITEPTNESADAVPNKNVWLDRVTYSDIGGNLTSSAVPGTEGIDTYSEELQSTDNLDPAVVDYDDVINNLSGNNKGHYRSVRDKLATDKVGTQHALPRTLMDYSAGDRFNLMRPVSINAEDSIVLILDQDSVAKTIDIKMSRTGRISSSFPPTDLSFSAHDVDNEPGITFSSLQVWGKTANKTEFKDYAVWFRSRNWYVSGGATSGGGAMLLRAREYGPHGDNYRFRIEYPTFPNQNSLVSHDTTPDYTTDTYVFGSGVIKATGVTAGDQISVTSLGGDDYRLTFLNPATNLATVVVGDIISMLADSGISIQNRGQFRIKGVNNLTKTVDVYNPNGAVTGVGSPEVSTVTTIADIVGSKTVVQFSGFTHVSGNPADINEDEYFELYDSAGKVAVVFDTDSIVNPPAFYGGANRIIVVKALGTDSDITVAAKTAAAITADPEFDAIAAGLVVTVTNADEGLFGTPTVGNLGATLTATILVAGSNPSSVDGKYFILPDVDGTVAFWYDVTGVTPQPLHGASRAVRIPTVAAGDGANTIATKTAVVINSDSAYASATVLANVITVTDGADGGRTGQSAGTSGFTVAQSVSGVNPVDETVAIATSIMIFSLTGTAVSDIVSKINSDSNILYAAEVDGTNPITKATRDEEYVPAGPNNYSLSLSYGHDPDPLNSINGYVSLYDGLSWVKQFENTAPNFTLKKALILQGVAPTAYSLDTAPNHDTADLGEFFKLVPVTLNNVYHHFTQKALSQLPIVSDISISNAIRKVQIKSKQLGSDGAVEVIGGNANSVDLSIFGDGQVSPGASKDFLEVKTAAFPVTLTKGDYVEVVNAQPTKRLSRLQLSDTIDVFKGVGSNVEYRWNHKDTQFSPYVRWTIADQSTTYGRPAGTIWRWTHNDGGSYFDITAVVNGAASIGPDDEIAAGITDAANLQFELFTLGINDLVVPPFTPGTKQHFRLTVSGVPTQADYFTFQTAGGVTFAVWFDVNNAGTAPTGATYIAATNKIEVDILSTDTEDQIVSALAIKLLSTPAFLTHFTGSQTQGANLDDVVAGDLLCAYNTFPGGWSSGNKAKSTGDTNVAGLPIINVNAASRYVDVVNPSGVAMTNQAIGTGSVNIAPSPIIRWNLKHSAKAAIVQISTVNLSTTYTVSTTSPHGLKEGDSTDISDNPLYSGATVTKTVVSVISPTQFTYTDVAAGSTATYLKGHVIKNGAAITRYAVESLGFNNLYKIRHIDGDAPGFIDCGIAIDDTLVISGDTFKSTNSGTFRILGVSNDALIFQNEIAVEELDTLVAFNNLDISVNWTSNSDQVIGIAGSFKNLATGDWVKKKEDDETLYRQVIGKNTGSFDTATIIYLGGNYQGTTATSIGVSLDQNSDINKGVYLSSINDIQVFEGDSARIDDTLFVDNIANTNWFSSVNSGSFNIVQIGSTSDCRPFVRIENSAGQSQTARQISVSPIGYFLLEGEKNTYRSMRRVEHTAIDVFNENRRQIFMVPATRAYKIAQANGSQIQPIGKLDYSTDVTTGIDGYTYYTGLMRTVQRIVDGYEPDSITYPGRRAIGGIIETLPPLIKRVSMTLQVTTNEGVNLNDVTNDIKSAIINYINTLGVGNDAILAEVIVRVMGITGVEAVTVSSLLATTEGRIPVSDNERAFIEPSDISVA
jgi:uncharacterized phage protein gp47/JayE